MKPAFSGTFSLNNILPGVVSINSDLSEVVILTFTIAFKSTFFSLYAIIASSGE